MQLCSPYVKRLQVKQLLPRPQEAFVVGEEGEGVSDDLEHALCNDHIDCGILLKSLHNMKELSLTYGLVKSWMYAEITSFHIISVENCGMNFEWGLFQFTMTDSENLVKGLKTTPTLHTLKITCSKMEEKEGRVLVKGLLEHPGLCVLGNCNLKPLKYNALNVLL